MQYSGIYNRAVTSLYANVCFGENRRRSGVKHCVFGGKKSSARRFSPKDFQLVLARSIQTQGCNYFCLDGHLYLFSTDLRKVRCTEDHCTWSVKPRPWSGVHWTWWVLWLWPCLSVRVSLHSCCCCYIQYAPVDLPVLLETLKTCYNCYNWVQSCCSSEICRMML